MKSNMQHISARAQRALNILADGGQFVHRLERNEYTGREQFAYRLIAAGNVAKGFGISVFHELKSAGFLKLAGGGTSVSTYYKLNSEAV